MKIKRKGIALRVRTMNADETICERTLCRLRNCYFDNPDAFEKSKCIGEKVSEHPDWEYVYVESKFWK